MRLLMCLRWHSLPQPSRGGQKCNRLAPSASFLPCPHCILLHHPSQAHPHPRTRLFGCKTSVVRALFDSQPVGDSLAGVQAVLKVGLLGAYLTSIVVSLSQVQKSETRRRWRRNDPDEEESTGVQWGVMAIISILPLFDWLAWVFAAQENQERAKQYYVFAALYAVPLITNGFHQDAFSITAVLACAAHVQVERIVQTEPQVITDGSLLSGLYPAVQRLLGSQNASEDQQKLPEPQLRSELPKKDNSSQKELEEWDARLQQRRKD